MELANPTVSTISARLESQAKLAPLRSFLNGATAWLGSLRIPPRVQAFEFCDQAWVRGSLREAYLDGLNFLFKAGRIYHSMHRPFRRWALAAGETRVLDLASGGGGPIETLLASARREHLTMPRVTLSDLYPDTEAFARVQQAHPGQVDFKPAPVDATGAVALREPLVSICTGFHHFAPPQAGQVLANVVAHTNGFFIMEVLPRNLLTPFLSLPMLPVLMLAPIFSRRFSWKKFALTTLLPLVPCMIVFDGMVSALRVYRPEELLALLPEHARREWRWESGAVRYLGVMRAPYFFGVRKRAENAR